MASTLRVRNMLGAIVQDRTRSRNTTPSCRAVLALALSIGALFPGVARADSSCDTLFSRLREAGGARVLWTTNYFAPSRNLRFMGTTDLFVNTEVTGDMTGNGTRMWQTIAIWGWGLQTSYESVSIRVRSDGKIMFQEQYGPFDPICSGDRFVRVDSGDSVEVFSMRATSIIP